MIHDSKNSSYNRKGWTRIVNNPHPDGPVYIFI